MGLKSWRERGRRRAQHGAAQIQLVTPGGRGRGQREEAKINNQNIRAHVFHELLKDTKLYLQEAL